MVMPLALLEKNVDKTVSLLLKDGRTLEGKLTGYDEYMNMVLEETMIDINGTRTVLHANTTVQVSKNGVPTGVTVKEGGTVISASDAVNQLIAEGVLVKI